MTACWRPVCVICLVILGNRAELAITLVAGDAICVDHAKLRTDCETLGLAIREARADLGERPTPPARPRWQVDERRT